MFTRASSATATLGRMADPANDHDGSGEREGVIRRTVEHLAERRREHRHEVEERELRAELAAAGYDVEADTGIEVERPERDYDVEVDTADEVHPGRETPSASPGGGSD